MPLPTSGGSRCPRTASLQSLPLFLFWLYWVFFAARAFLYLQRAQATLVAMYGLLIAVTSLVAEKRSL